MAGERTTNRYSDLQMLVILYKLSVAQGWPRKVIACALVWAMTSFFGCSGRSRVPVVSGPEPPPVTSVPELETAPSAPPPTLQVVVEPTAIPRGAFALLQWEARYADQVTIDHNIGMVETSGRIKFFPEETTVYEVSADGPGGRVTETVRIEVLGDRSRILEQDLIGRSLDEQFNDFMKPVFFGYDSAELSEEAKKVLDGNMRWLERVENIGVEFVIEGHCDQRGTEEYNLALGDRRALVVMEYIKDQGLNAARIETLTMGEENPMDPRSTEEAWALNRRAHFFLVR